MRRLHSVVACMVVTLAGFAVQDRAPAAERGVGLIKQRVEFTVKNPAENGASHQLVGYRYDTYCNSPTAILLLHGLSYTKEAWDFPGYSVAQKLAAAGYAVIAVDRLGYGESKLQNGYDVTHEAYADMAHQLVGQLRSQGFQHVVLAGHSAGAGTTELEAGLYGDVDAIIPMGWHHRPSNQLGQDFFTGDYLRAAQASYEYFLGTPAHRAEMFYTPTADPNVVEADTRAAVDTPSGEIFSIGAQPSRLVVGGIKVPVFLQFGESDRLFEVEYAQQHAAEFRSSPSVTVDIVKDAGHTFMLTKNGPAGIDRMVDWLHSRPEAPSCR
ncbi:MAG TPA: alpha/beta hydrolase [Acidimicrobiia bacterium]